MNSIREDISDYLSMRRALGFKLKVHGKFLNNFADFYESKECDYITTKLAVEWAEQATSAGSRSQRLSYLRSFARFRTASDSRTEVPPENLYPFRPKRAKPYLYSDEEIKKVMEAANGLPNPFRARTFHCLLGLLAVTGMRIGEVLGLELKNVDFTNGMLVVEGAKNGKSRLVPLHSTTLDALRKYTKCREDFLDGKPAAHFFISLNGTQLDKACVSRTFYELSEQAGFRPAGSSSGPRFHDFRHSFAVRSLLRWYRCGANIEQRLPLLSAYLGHVHVSDTYWYLTTAPELMDLGVNLLAHRWEDE